MLDHISFGVSDLARSMAFYDAVLPPMGFVRVWTSKHAAGYGYPNHDENFAIRQELAEVIPGTPQSHFAFVAPNRESVIRFHATAIARGASDEGTPELCPEYGENYFAAFVRDPDGYRIEAVCHGPF